MNQDLAIIEEAFENIPSEVKRFIYSANFSKSLKELLTKEELSVEQMAHLKTVLYGYIAQLESEETLLKTIYSVARTAESSQRIISWIKTELTDKILSLVTEEYIHQEEESDEELPNTPSSQIFNSIQDQLNKPSTVAPIVRDYSIGKGEASSPVETPRTPVVDIYREIPEK